MRSGGSCKTSENHRVRTYDVRTCYGKKANKYLISYSRVLVTLWYWILSLLLSSLPGVSLPGDLLLPRVLRGQGVSTLHWPGTLHYTILHYITLN